MLTGSHIINTLSRFMDEEYILQTSFRDRLDYLGYYSKETDAGLVFRYDDDLPEVYIFRDEEDIMITVKVFLCKLPDISADVRDAIDEKNHGSDIGHCEEYVVQNNDVFFVMKEYWYNSVDDSDEIRKICYMVDEFIEKAPSVKQFVKEIKKIAEC